jgi:tyrosine-protein phosphatase YwqE
MIDKEEAIALLGGPKQKLPDNPRTPEEILAAMKSASANYYREAIATNCHAFIEFTGLINEYVKICDENLRAGNDFTQANIHTKSGTQSLIMSPHNIDYLNEKIQCIFEGRLMLVEVVDE